MERASFDSSNITSGSYDPDSRTLEITFHHGKTYRYFDVEPETWQDLQEAPSAGSYHRKYIAGHYEHRVLP